MPRSACVFVVASAARVTVLAYGCMEQRPFICGATVVHTHTHTHVVRRMEADERRTRKRTILLQLPMAQLLTASQPHPMQP